MRKKTGIFVGSFDPFTEGHLSVVERSLPLFDEIIIGVGVNPIKNYAYTVEERIGRIAEAISHLGEMADKVNVESYEGLTIDFARKHDSLYIIKGVRNADDFVYEQQQADWNRKNGGIETLFIPSTPELRHVSSTWVKQQQQSNVEMKQNQQ